jgi:hypothetical protein
VLAAMAESFLFCIKAYFLLASVGMGMLCSTAILIIFHSSADSRTFSLLARESVVSPSAK